MTVEQKDKEWEKKIFLNRGDKGQHSMKMSSEKKEEKKMVHRKFFKMQENSRN